MVTAVAEVLKLMLVVFVHGLSDKLIAGVGLVRVVMALATVISWAALVLFRQVRLMGLSVGLNVVLNVGITWAAMLVVLIGVLVVVAWEAVFVFVSGVSDELMAVVVL